VEGDELLANSSANSRTASASSEQSYLILLDSVSEVVVRRAGESTSRLNRFVGAFIKSLPATGRSVAEIEQSYSSPVMTYITQRVIHRDSEQGTTVTMLSALSVIFVDGFSQLPLSSDYQSNLATRVESVMTPVVSSTAGSDRDFSASVDTIFSGLSSTEVAAEPVEQVAQAIRG
jgi:predicted GTPase